jgi:hypothetical protein
MEQVLHYQAQDRQSKVRKKIGRRGKREEGGGLNMNTILRIDDQLFLARGGGGWRIGGRGRAGIKFDVDVFVDPSRTGLIQEPVELGDVSLEMAGQVLGLDDQMVRLVFRMVRPRSRDRGEDVKRQFVVWRRIVNRLVFPVLNPHPPRYQLRFDLSCREIG